uniref:Uncharacterized protein n=1 Tax=Leersia perrieri TaxID=77586 RepID=A0A0D9UZY7_9ORYZ
MLWHAEQEVIMRSARGLVNFETLQKVAKDLLYDESKGRFQMSLAAGTNHLCGRLVSAQAAKTDLSWRLRPIEGRCPLPPPTPSRLQRPISAAWKISFGILLLD